MRWFCFSLPAFAGPTKDGDIRVSPAAASYVTDNPPAAGVKFWRVSGGEDVPAFFSIHSSASIGEKLDLRPSISLAPKHAHPFGSFQSGQMVRR